MRRLIFTVISAMKVIQLNYRPFTYLFGSYCLYMILILWVFVCFLRHDGGLGSRDIGEGGGVEEE